ncbi:MAG TPA: GNAT family N-acetyltransferase [Bacteroidota bacterium]|nr:GNAT family N-acetyltransferase [Bacteroidota bacterium]
MPNEVRVRKALADDAPAILQLVDGLAAYERLTPPDDGAKRRLIKDMFGDRRRIEAFLAEFDGKPVGYAFVYETYSSFLALPTMYLEDIFVLPEYRKMKAGYSLFRAVAREARLRGCGRMEWTVLDWNTPAIEFYRRFGAKHMKEWHLYRLAGQEIERVAETSLE